jgi:hemerythrin
MSLFVWRNEYSVHHATIDQQHQQLFRLADELHGAMMRGAGRQVMGETLKRLIDYTVTHFRDEEQMMVRSRYPQYTQHKAEHDRLTQQVSALKQDFDRGQIAVTVETLQFLKGWLEHHIKGSDHRIADFLASARR